MGIYRDWLGNASTCYHVMFAMEMRSRPKWSMRRFTHGKPLAVDGSYLVDQVDLCQLDSLSLS
jgi:hypothetical protein